jgi:hypothetical protein
MIMDYSCYITIMNKSTIAMQSITYSVSAGQYTTLPPTSIDAGQQPYFILQGDEFSGSAGSVTLQVDGGGTVTVAFSCPRLESNSAEVTQLTASSVVVQNYGAIGFIDWDPDGGNWPTENNIPPAGHPLSALFVIQSSGDADASPSPSALPFSVDGGSDDA